MDASQATQGSISYHWPSSYSMTCSTSWATATLACICVKISLLKQWATRYYCYYSMHTGVLTCGSTILKAEYKKHCFSSLFIVLASSTGNYHHCNSEHIYTAHISFQIMRYSRDCSLVSQLFRSSQEPGALWFLSCAGQPDLEHSQRFFVWFAWLFWQQLTLIRDCSSSTMNCS